MKKITFIAIASIVIFACTPKKETNDNLNKFNKNLVTAKQFIEVFSARDSIKEAALFSEDFTWDGTEIGQDALPKEALLNGDKGIMKMFKEIKFKDADFYPGLDSTYQLNSDVRVYGTWVSKFASNGKTSRMKYYAVFHFNDAGLITGLRERCNVADLTKELDK
jgi:hypothetical protein